MLDALDYGRFSRPVGRCLLVFADKVKFRHHRILTGPKGSAAPMFVLLPKIGCFGVDRP